MAFWAALGAFAGTSLGGSILSGIGGLFGGRSKRKQAEQDAKNQMALAKETAKVSGEENRKTALYEAQLASAADEYQRARHRGAASNFGFASANDPYAATAMQGYEQQWKPEDTQLKLPNVPGTTQPQAPAINAVPRR